MAEAVTLAFLRPALLLIALLATPSVAFAHRLDEYLQATIVAIEPSDIRLQMNLTPGVDVADRLLARMDLDHDGIISPPEAAAYAESVRRDLIVRLDQRALELRLTASNFPTIDELRTGWGIIQLEFSAALSPPAGAHSLSIRNGHLANLSVYLINAAQPKASSLQITGQTRNVNQSEGRIDFFCQTPPKQSIPPGIVISLAALFGAGCIWGLDAIKRSRRVS